MSRVSRAAQRYINRIRNVEKRQYAVAYALFLDGKGEQPLVTRCSYMAGQAVRQRLHQIYDSTLRGRA